MDTNTFLPESENKNKDDSSTSSGTNKKDGLSSTTSLLFCEDQTRNPSDSDVASTSSSCMSDTHAKLMVDRAIRHYLNSLSSTTTEVCNDITIKNVKVEVGRTTEKNYYSFSQSNSSSQSSDACVMKKTKNCAITAEDGNTSTEDKANDGTAKAHNENSKSADIVTVNGNANNTVADTSAPSVLRLYSSLSHEGLSSEILLSKIYKCTYHDRSHITPEAVLSETKKKSSSKRNTTNEHSFTQKLHEILSKPEFRKWIVWLPHGRAWKIIKSKKFEANVLPQYFRHGKLESFMRQVRNWGFRRIPDGPDQNAYYNEYFLRGLPHISAKMIRQPIKRKEERCDSVFARIRMTPDFYQISKKYPLPE